MAHLEGIGICREKRKGIPTVQITVLLMNRTAEEEIVIPNTKALFCAISFIVFPSSASELQEPNSMIKYGKGGSEEYNDL